MNDAAFGTSGHTEHEEASWALVPALTTVKEWQCFTESAPRTVGLRTQNLSTMTTRLSSPGVLTG